MIDAAIIGAGPVGLVLANLLGRRGRSVVVLEKQRQHYPLPRAIHFDAEAMRVFQAAGLAERVLAHTHVGRGMLFRDTSGNTLVDWSRDPMPGPLGWHESYRFYQPGLEAELRVGLGRFAQVDLRGGAEVDGITQTADGVTVRLTDGAKLRARYAIGCDGANSVIRQAMGSDLQDLGFRERWLVADLILRGGRGDLGDHSIQFCDPEAPATYVRGVGSRRRWEARVTNAFPAEPSARDVWRVLSRWTRPDDAELERAAVYTFRSRIATAWRRGRVLIAGDAAHQMPPFMGQGLGAGLRDAANLFWKLDAVLRGAAPDLLETYQTERAPNARAFIERSVALGRLINQTAAGVVPRGKMRSIWPDLGPGLGLRDGIGGTLAPQPRGADGQLADDVAGGDFYVLSAEGFEPIEGWTRIPQAQDWLRGHGLTGAVIRPDGYTLGGYRGPDERTALTEMAERWRKTSA